MYLFIKNTEGKRPVNSKIKTFKKWLKVYKQRNRFPSPVGRKASFQQETETHSSACATQFPLTVYETLNKSLLKRCQGGLDYNLENRMNNWKN